MTHRGRWSEHVVPRVTDAVLASAQHQRIRQRAPDDRTLRWQRRIDPLLAKAGLPAAGLTRYAVPRQPRLFAYLYEGRSVLR